MEMIFASLCQIAHKSGVPQATLYQMVRRGVLPHGDAMVARRRYYSADLAENIVRWLKLSYSPHERYDGLQIKDIKETK